LFTNENEVATLTGFEPVLRIKPCSDSCFPSWLNTLKQRWTLTNVMHKLYALYGNRSPSTGPTVLVLRILDLRRGHRHQQTRLPLNQNGRQKARAGNLSHLE